MKKVSELEGSELDYWVARAEGLKRGQSNWVAYSERWSVGGPIIEREGITIEAIWSVSGSLPVNVWHAERNSIDYQSGTTPLIAAMRCFVASKFGEEVDDSQTHNL